MSGSGEALIDRFSGCWPATKLPAPTDGLWPGRSVGGSPGKLPIRTSGCPGRSPARGRDLTLRKRILCDPQLDGRSSWVPQALPCTRAVEHGQDRRAEGTLQAQGHLGTASPPSDGEPGARTRAFHQPGHRPQATQLRSRRTQTFPQRSTWISATVRSRPFTVSLVKALGDAAGSRWIRTRSP